LWNIHCRFLGEQILLSSFISSYSHKFFYVKLCYIIYVFLTFVNNCNCRVSTTNLYYTCISLDAYCTIAGHTSQDLLP
jgi:hypothetical protein